MSTERRLVPIPNGPSATPGVASMMPGARAGNISGAVARVPRVKLQSQAPRGYRAKSGVLVDGDALAAGEMGEARAAARKGAAVQGALNDIGQELGGALQRIVIAREKAEIDEANAAMDAAWQAFQADLPADPSDWSESYSAKVDELRDSLLSDDKRYSKALREKLTGDFDKWTKVSGARLQTMAVERNRSIAKFKSGAAFDQAVEFENMDRAAEVMMGMVQNGLITSEEASVKLANAERGISAKQNWRNSYNDPFAAEERLKAGAFGEMTPDDQFKLTKMIEGRKQEVRRDQFAAAQDWLTAHPEATESQAMNAVYENGPNLEPADWEALNKHRLDTMKPGPAKINAFYTKAISFTERTPAAELAQFEYEVRREIPSYYQGNVLNAMGGSVNGRNQQFKVRMDRIMGIVDGHYSDMQDPVNIMRVPQEFLIPDTVGKSRIISKAKIEASQAQARDAVMSYLLNPANLPEGDDGFALSLGIPLPPKSAAEKKAQQRKTDTDKHSIKTPKWRYQKPGAPVLSKEEQGRFATDALSQMR